ncbi:lipopolysaccharide kinase InaA family protein [Dysgonomonas sp. 520]|uniref:lipopolysaccharide kinase InaA family protein n=1 Tax=Dysgonomonas sp. 520 TaxID=2302931 RepID=UPI0013D427BD|nr:lipopolysaccharide kinase InaA family protein [Dysgonomonas sp. 520]NDW10293.1 hypothetical protein [Dysgonomonas sp. 520]
MGENKKIIISRNYENTPLVRNFIENLPETFSSNGTVIFSARNVIKSFAIDSSDETLKDVVVKRYKKPYFLQRVIYSFFRKSKAKRAFYNAMELRKRNVDTPQEIAFLEEWENGLFKYGYFISGSNYSPPIREKLIDLEIFDHAIAKDFAFFVAELHQKGILHRDLNSTNVLYHQQEGHNTFSLIDINRMDFLSSGKQLSISDCFNNLTRFTGRMDLYEYVLQHYIEARGWDKDTTLGEAIGIKMRHDKQWKRRKSFTRMFSLKRKK